MKSVRCLFRVLHVSTDYDGIHAVSIAPTYSTRDGVQCEENRSFATATPSGEGDLRLGKGATLAELMKPGEYVYLDIYHDDDNTPAPAEDAIRTRWSVVRVVVDPNQFEAHMGLHYGQTADNDAAFGSRGWGADKVKITVSNLACWPFFAIVPDNDAVPRPLVIDFRAG